MWKLIVIAVVIIAVVGVIVYRIKKQRKGKAIQGHRKHATGYIQYHDKTKTRVKRAINAPAETKAEADRVQAVAVLTFKGDLRASSRKDLSKLIDEIILNKHRFEEVVAAIESPGGSVTDYGHVFSEMARLRSAGLNLTACVDTVAASGGYLACIPANKIMAAPFAMVGSIGVVSFVPNIRRLLQRLDIEPRTFTAGAYKRTVTLTDDATPEQVELYRLQLELIHDQFKQALQAFRPQVELAKVATGEAWLASTTVQLNLKLVDEIRVTSDYLLERNRDLDLVEYSFQEPKNRMKFITKLFSSFAQAVADEAAEKVAESSIAI